MNKMTTKKIAEKIAESVDGKVISFKISETRATGELEYGVIFFRESKTTIQKIHLMDTLSEIFGCKIEGQRMNEGKTLMVWNPSKFSSVKHVDPHHVQFEPVK